MSRLNAPSPDAVPDGARGILDQVGAQFGFAPNMFATLASNPTPTLLCFPDRRSSMETTSAWQLQPASSRTRLWLFLIGLCEAPSEP